ncbi:transposase [Maricaulis alexandrii]|uniref:transposase n=1 Tax=Maricaulis alexandrii TaxID=2570354 RepID=UPI0011081B3F|nr:transposase [Maricaulis alexandrii]
MKRRTTTIGTPVKHLSESQNLRREDFDALTDEQVVELWVRLRFSQNGGKPKCPECGSEDPYYIKSRCSFRCRRPNCGKNFSLTAGTPFHRRKKPLRDILKAMCEIALEHQHLTVSNLASSIRLSRKTACVWIQKFGELALGRQFDGVFTTPVSYDTAEFHGRLRNQNLRTRGKAAKGRNSKTRLHYLVIKENRHAGRMVLKPFQNLQAPEITKYLKSKIARNTTTFIDEAAGWKRLWGYHKQITIKHKTSYWAKGSEGEPDRHTNHAEAVFAGLRARERFARGWSPKYAHLRCAEECFRRECSNRDAIDTFYELGNALAVTGVSKFKGYWQWYRTNEEPSTCARGVHTRSSEEWKQHFQPKFRRTLASTL